MPEPRCSDPLEAHVSSPAAAQPDPIEVGVVARVAYDPEPQPFSVSWQEAACRDHAQRQGWRVAETHREVGRAAPAPREDRPAYRAVLDWLQAGKIQGILVVRPDRLFHSVQEFDQVMPQIEQAGGFVIAVHEGLDSRRAIGRANLRQRLIQPDRQPRLPQPPWRRPFGLTIDKKGIVPAEAAVLRLAADLIRQGKTYQEAAEELNRQGFRTPRGNDFTAEQVNTHLKRPEVEALIVGGSLRTRPPRVGPFERVPVPLEGLVDCGRCDEPLVGTSRDGHVRYECVAEGCLGVAIVQSELETRVATQIVNELAVPGRKEEILRAVDDRPAVAGQAAVIEAQQERLKQVVQELRQGPDPTLQTAGQAALQRIELAKGSIRQHRIEQLGVDLQEWGRLGTRGRSGRQGMWRRFQELPAEGQHKLAGAVAEKITVEPQRRGVKQIKVTARDWTEWVGSRPVWRSHDGHDSSHRRTSEAEHDR